MPSSSIKRRGRLPLAVATRAKSPLALRVHGVCVCCGGRNVVRFGSQLPHVQCRSCGVVSPDCIQRKPPHGYQDENQPVEPLNKNQCHELIDELLDALAQEKTAHKAQSLLNKAHGDVVLICHFYVPFVLDVCAVVVAKYSFSASVEGVKESLRVMQRHATSDDTNDSQQQLTQKLVRLRRVLTPTGQWIQDDAESDAADLLKQKDELEQRRQKLEEAKRMELLALENANKAKLRAKKIALGLDPTLVRLPQLESVPKRVVVAYADACVVLRVVARFTYQFQWFCNSKPLPVDGDLVSGSRRSTLTIRRLTKRTVGDYYCVCTNDEGAVSSPTTQVQSLAIGSRRLAMRKLKTLPSGVGSASIVPLVWSRSGGGRHQPPLSVIALCVGGSLSLLHTKTLAPVKTLPPIAVPPVSSTTSGATATAWLPAAKLLAIATSPLRQPPVQPQQEPTIRKKKNAASPPAVCELSIYSLDLVAPPPPAAPSSVSTGASPSSPHKPIKTTPTKSLDPKPSSNNSTNNTTSTSNNPSTSNSTSTAQQPTPASSPPPQVLLSRLISTHSVPSLKTIACVRFLDNGRLLLISDLHAFVQIFELAPTFSCKRTLRFDHQPQEPLCDIASTTTHSASASVSSKDAFTGFALCFRSCSQLELYDVERLENQTLQFQLPVHRSAFDRQGFTLAVAEAGSIKSWISIVSIHKGFRTSTTSTGSARRRFVAHVGKISGIHWTTQSSLLVTSGYDGYVKLWDLHTSRKRGDPVCCIFQGHLDFRGVHSLRLLDDDPADPEDPNDPFSFVAMGFTDCRLHARELPQLRELETTRRDDLDRVAAQIQKIWKGRRTRELINQFIRPTTKV